MSSAYPSGLDALSTAHADGVGEAIAAATVNDLADAVNKIEAELGTLPKGVAASVKARIAATETVANAAVPLSTVTTAGDLIYGTGAATVTRLAAGAAGKLLTTGTAPSWVYPPGYRFDYAQITTNATGTATTEGTAATVVTGGSVTYDGSTTISIEFFAPAVSHSVANSAIIFILYDVTAAASLGFLTQVIPNGTGANMAIGKREITPAAGARSYAIKMYSGTAGTETVFCGAGTAGVFNPAYLKITKSA